MLNRECIPYLKQACVNEKLASFLTDGKDMRCFYRWAFVALYYSALHFFNAFLIAKYLPLPKIHKNKNIFDVYSGDIESAKNHFCISKNNILHSASGDYEQLFNWSCDVRYVPDQKPDQTNRTDLLSMADFKVARKSLEGIKLITFGTLGYAPRFSENEESLFLDKVSDADIQKLFQQYKQKIP